MGSDYYVTPQKSISKVSKKSLLIGVFLALAVIVAIFLLIAGSGNKLSDQLQRLSLRTSSLQTYLDSSNVTAKLNSNELRQLRLELSLNLQSHTNDIKPLISASLPDKYDQKIVTSETDTTSIQKLDEADINNRLDQVFIEILQQKIITIRPLIAEIHAKTNSVELRNVLTKLDKTLLEATETLDAIKL